MFLTRDDNLSELDWSPPDDATKTRGYACFIRTNWEAIREVASQANNGKSCKLSTHYRAGGNFLARQLVFEDGSRWIARVQLHKATREASQGLRIEIDTMILLRIKKAPVPRIFAFEIDDTNPAHSAFILLEFIPGNTAAEEAGGYDWSLVQRQHRPILYQTMTTAHVQIASARLPKIGAVIHHNDSSFTVGAIPGLGGPFDTAASFIEAWATRMKFPVEEDEVRKRVPLSLIDEVLEGTRSFPARLTLLARSGKHFTLEGPFPIRHADLFHSNVIVTKNYHVLGVIDWEGSYTMPWELVDAPCFLTTVPRLLNPSEQYKSGRPLDQDEVEKWEDEDVYATLVGDAERNACADNKLSHTLADRNTRDLAALVHLYSQGKLGLYGRALDYFENM